PGRPTRVSTLLLFDQREAVRGEEGGVITGGDVQIPAPVEGQRTCRVRVRLPLATERASGEQSLLARHVHLATGLSEPQQIRSASPSSRNAADRASLELRVVGEPEQACRLAVISGEYREILHFGDPQRPPGRRFSACRCVG